MRNGLLTGTQTNESIRHHILRNVGKRERLPYRITLQFLGETPAEDDTRSSENQASAALARVRFFQSTRKTFISALSTSNRAATPLYFLMTPVAVLVTAP